MELVWIRIEYQWEEERTNEWTPSNAIYLNELFSNNLLSLFLLPLPLSLRLFAFSLSCSLSHSLFLHTQLFSLSFSLISLSLSLYVLSISLSLYLSISIPLSLSLSLSLYVLPLSHTHTCKHTHFHSFKRTHSSHKSLLSVANWNYAAIQIFFAKSSCSSCFQKHSLCIIIKITLQS